MAQKLKLDPPAKRRYSEPKDYISPYEQGSDRWRKLERHSQTYDIPGDYDTETHHINRQTVSDSYENFDKQGWKYIRSYKTQSKNQLYPCIGGPMDGKKIYHGHPNEKEYVDYNCASGSDRGRGLKPYPSLVFIHKSML